MVKQEGAKIYALDGHDFKKMIWAALCWLRQHQAAINALNVFPVPDGDTGTNMALTMTSAWNEIINLEEDNIGRLSGKVAHGALMGARGNSGVILSQIWRGFSRSLDSKPVLRAADLASATREAAETAYKGVVKPVEGTILTVVREVADETEEIAKRTDDLVRIFERMVERAKAAEMRTPALLPVLQQAGVVDSGGQGLVVILEGMWRQMIGLPVEEKEGGRFAQVVDLAQRAETELDLAEANEYSYDVQFILVGQNMDVEQIRADISALGKSGLIVGDPMTIKVHIHVPDPGLALSYGVQWGALRDVVVEDMRAQYQEFIAGRDVHPVLGPGSELPAVLVAPEPPTIGVVVVSAGDGLDRVFRSLGATAIVPGGETMNPSTAEILEAVRQVSSDKVVILPNNKNIVLAAEQAAQVSEKEVVVVPTKSIPQGVAALLALDQQATLDGNVQVMLQAAQQIISGGVTCATRNVTLNGVEVHQGDIIGLLDGELVLAGHSVPTVMVELLEKADLEERELITLYYGEGTDQQQADTLAHTFTERHPDLEIEVVHGGQPYYPYLFSIE